MCEMVSWIEVGKEGKKNVLFLTNDDVFSERGRQMLEECKDNDFLGHHAIRYVWELPSGGVQKERQNFWETEFLPKEIQVKLHDFKSFKQNFGRMVESYAQEDDLEYIVQNAPSDKKWRGLKSFCKGILKDLPMRDVKTEVLEVNVRHDLSVDELVKANKFGWKNDDVSSQHYPARKAKAKKQELVLVSLGLYAKDSKDVIRVMKALKLKPAYPVHLLSLGLDHPNRQKENLIVALGQTWRDSDGYRCVPYLFFNDERLLFLCWYDNDWSAGCRFLAVRNS